MRPTREGYIEGLLEAAEMDKRVIVVDGDVSRSTGTIAFKRRFPERFYNLGIAEQNMAEYSAGLALAGYIPFYSTYAVFAAGRAWDQIRIFLIQCRKKAANHFLKVIVNCMRLALEQ